MAIYYFVYLCFCIKNNYTHKEICNYSFLNSSILSINFCLIGLETSFMLLYGIIKRETDRTPPLLDLTDEVPNYIEIPYLFQIFP